jgi:hypothetical protein
MARIIRERAPLSFNGIRRIPCTGLIRSLTKNALIEKGGVSESGTIVSVDETIDAMSLGDAIVQHDDSMYPKAEDISFEGRTSDVSRICRDKVDIGFLSVQGVSPQLGD